MLNANKRVYSKKIIYSESIFSYDNCLLLLIIIFIALLFDRAATTITYNSCPPFRVLCSAQNDLLIVPKVQTNCKQK